MKTYDQIEEATGAIGTKILDAGFRVHRSLGPGLLESIYEECLSYELARRSVGFLRQPQLQVTYEGLMLDAACRLDLLVEERIVVEIKAVEALHPVHTAQLLTYMRISECRLGYLLNFHVAYFKEGIWRLVL